MRLRNSSTQEQEKGRTVLGETDEMHGPQVRNLWESSMHEFEALQCFNFSRDLESPEMPLMFNIKDLASPTSASPLDQSISCFHRTSYTVTLTSPRRGSTCIDFWKSVSFFYVTRLLAEHPTYDYKKWCLRFRDFGSDLREWHPKRI